MRFRKVPATSPSPSTFRSTSTDITSMWAVGVHSLEPLAEKESFYGR